MTKDQIERIKDHAPYKLRMSDATVLDTNGVALMQLGGVSDWDRAVVAALNEIAKTGKAQLVSKP